MNKFVTGEEINSVELLRGRVYYLRVADDITKMTTIVATFVETTSDGARTTCEFEDAYVKGPDKINADKLIAGGRVSIKNYDGDKAAPFAAVFNPTTLKSKKLRATPFLLSPEQQRDVEAEQDGIRRYELDKSNALLLRQQHEATQTQEMQMAYSKYMMATGDEKDAEKRRMAELKRAHAKQNTASKRITANQFKEAERQLSSPKEFNLNDVPFEEGKTYALQGLKGAIVATFRNRNDKYEYNFDEAKGNYASNLITKDGRVSLRHISPIKNVVFNPRTMDWSLLLSPPTMIALTNEQLDASLSAASSEGLVYRPTNRISPYMPSRKTRLKSTMKRRPVPTSIESFLTTTLAAANEAPDLAYSTMDTATDLGYLYLMKKYKSRCVLAGRLVYIPTPDGGKLIYHIPSKYVVKKAAALGDELMKCAGVPVVFIPFRIRYSSTNMAHANMLIYRPSQRLVERFEPHVESVPKINVALKTLFEETLRPKLGPTEFKFPQEEMNAALEKLNLPPNKGLQELEMKAVWKKEEEGGGYCQMWSLFIMECILINPEMSTEAIIRQCYEVSKADPQYLRDLIRGYVQVMSTELEKEMGKKAVIKRKNVLTQKQRAKIAHLAEALAALRQKRHARTHKNEGSASSHSSAFKDSSGYSTEMELP